MAKRKYGSYKNTPSKRRRYAKKRRPRSKRSRSLYSLPVGGFPKSKMVRLRYASEVIINPGIGGLQGYTFSANGMYDPDITSGGHQPYGFDQNMLYFDHYTVVASRCRARFTPNTTGNVTPGYFDVQLTDSGTQTAAYTNVLHFLESSFSRGATKQIGTERNYVGWSPWCSKSFSAKKFFKKGSVTSDTTLQGSKTTNPSEQAYYEVIVGSIGANDPSPMNIMVMIDYWAVLKEPSLAPPS